MKKLTRSTEKIVAGVLAGIAEYFELDASLVRLGFVVLLIFTGLFPFGLFYLIAWMIVPVKNGEAIVTSAPDTSSTQHGSHETSGTI